MSANEPQAPQPPPLEVPEDLEPVYVNLVRIAHTPSELVFDFGRILPGSKMARVHSRVMMSPMSAKLLHRALSENLAKYEAAYGEIVIPGQNQLTEYAKLFRPDKSQEGTADQE